MRERGGPCQAGPDTGADCARFGGRSSGPLNSIGITPIDMAVRIYLACSPPVHAFLCNHGDHYLPYAAPLRPCLTAADDVDVTTTAVVSACTDSSEPGKHKKSVVFADSQGLELTTIHVLDEVEENDLSELQFQLTQIEDATSRLKLEDSAGSGNSAPDLVLGFTPPAVDYLNLWNRLKTQHVCLETCSVQDRLLSGTVQVQNICFEKSVWVRITFDSWTSFQDVRCQHLNNIYASPDVDTFSFIIEVPASCKSGTHVQFCIQFCSGQQTFWDNNHGNNYGLMTVDQKGSYSEGCLTALPIFVAEKNLDIDPFGSPRTSAGTFPQWQSCGHIQTSY